MLMLLHCRQLWLLVRFRLAERTSTLRSVGREQTLPEVASMHEGVCVVVAVASKAVPLAKADVAIIPRMAEAGSCLGDAEVA